MNCEEYSLRSSWKLFSICFAVFLTCFLSNCIEFSYILVAFLKCSKYSVASVLQTVSSLPEILKYKKPLENAGHVFYFYFLLWWLLNFCFFEGRIPPNILVVSCGPPALSSPRSLWQSHRMMSDAFIPALTIFCYGSYWMKLFL